jgi:hypothetical protein
MSPQAKKKKSGVPEEKLALFDKLIAVRPEIERKGANNAYAAVNGNMFLLMQVDGVLAIRLPEDEREEYAAVPDVVLGKTKELQKYVAASYDYAKTLKAKGTKKGR